VYGAVKKGREGRKGKKHHCVAKGLRLRIPLCNLTVFNSYFLMPRRPLCQSTLAPSRSHLAAAKWISPPRGFRLAPAWGLHPSLLRGDSIPPASGLHPSLLPGDFLHPPTAPPGAGTRPSRCAPPLRPSQSRCSLHPRVWASWLSAPSLTGSV